MLVGIGYMKKGLYPQVQPLYKQIKKSVI